MTDRMRAVPAAGEPLEHGERPVPDPAAHGIRVEVQVWHLPQRRLRQGWNLPQRQLLTGHEFAGVVDATPLLCAGITTFDAFRDTDAKPGPVVGTREAVEGWVSGHAKGWEDTLEFSSLRDVTPDVETYPLSEVESASDRMIEDEARFRAVLEP